MIQISENLYINKNLILTIKKVTDSIYYGTINSFEIETTKGTYVIHEYSKLYKNIEKFLGDSNE